tara:strand:- start:143 stop:931 length:789 start_codon:yes stop_codon:yes gene_type:complete
MDDSSKDAKWFSEQLKTNPEITMMLLDSYLNQGRLDSARLAHSEEVTTDVLAINKEARETSKLVRAENIKLIKNNGILQKDNTRLISDKTTMVHQLEFKPSQLSAIATLHKSFSGDDAIVRFRAFLEEELSKMGMGMGMPPADTIVDASMVGPVKGTNNRVCFEMTGINNNMKIVIMCNNTIKPSKNGMRLDGTAFEQGKKTLGQHLESLKSRIQTHFFPTSEETEKADEVKAGKKRKRDEKEDEKTWLEERRQQQRQQSAA